MWESGFLARGRACALCPGRGPSGPNSMAPSSFQDAARLGQPAAPGDSPQLRLGQLAIWLQGNVAEGPGHPGGLPKESSPEQGSLPEDASQTQRAFTGWHPPMPQLNPGRLQHCQAAVGSPLLKVPHIDPLPPPRAFRIGLLRSWSCLVVPRSMSRTGSSSDFQQFSPAGLGSSPPCQPSPCAPID